MAAEITLLISSAPLYVNIFTTGVKKIIAFCVSLSSFFMSLIIAALWCFLIAVLWCFLLTLRCLALFVKYFAMSSYYRILDRSIGRKWLKIKVFKCGKFATGSAGRPEIHAVMFDKNSQACPYRPAVAHRNFPNLKPGKCRKISTLFHEARLGRYPDILKAPFAMLQIVQIREGDGVALGIWRKKILIYFSARGIRRFATVYSGQTGLIRGEYLLGGIGRVV
ncbi:hypothetical protein [Paenibacillus piscarius]|uniref:hypothetical protein n=1 Tax=Paenibacillus piscarius TaxID=1089681 RepID=UPI001EE7F31A|nr:hypothetical protein [Paenibacillus piscarius]